jgi:hypothetical protein
MGDTRVVGMLSLKSAMQTERRRGRLLKASALGCGLRGVGILIKGCWLGGVG